MIPQPRTPTLLIAIFVRSLHARARDSATLLLKIRRRGAYGAQPPKVSRVPERMTSGRRQRAGFVVAVLCAAFLAWAAAGLPGSTAPAPPAGAAPRAHSAANCDQACQARRREKRAQLRRRNALQKRPNVIVIDTDDMNAAD